MGVFSRMSDIVNSNINAMLDRAEDPEKMVRLIIQEMEDTLVEIRSGAARTIADCKDLDRRMAYITREADEWQRRAELAVSKRRDDLAKAALVEKNRAATELGSLQAQHKEATLGLSKLNDDIVALQAKLADAKHRQKALESRYRMVSHRLRARGHIYDDRTNNALGRFEDYERKLETMEGRVDAYDIGKQSDLEREFATLEGSDRVDTELEALKIKHGHEPTPNKE